MKNFVILYIGYVLIFIGCNGSSIYPDECKMQQKNQHACTVLPYYNQYQKVICLDDKEIEFRSNGKFKCLNRHVKEEGKVRSYCWYPECQMGKYNYGFNPDVHTSCRCDEQSKNYCKFDIDHGKKRCLKLPYYDSAQTVTCLTSREVLNRAFGSGCPFPETHCWYTCQYDKHQQPNGKVEDDCSCSSSNILSPIKLLPGFCIVSIIVVMLY